MNQYVLVCGKKPNTALVGTFMMKFRADNASRTLVKPQLFEVQCDKMGRVPISELAKICKTLGYGDENA